jgi:hypothetical protein
MHFLCTLPNFPLTQENVPVLPQFVQVAGHRPTTILTMWNRPDSHIARLIVGLTFGTFTTLLLIVDLPRGSFFTRSAVVFPIILVGSVLLRPLGIYLIGAMLVGALLGAILTGR